MNAHTKQVRTQCGALRKAVHNTRYFNIFGKTERAHEVGAPTVRCTTQGAHHTMDHQSPSSSHLLPPSLCLYVVHQGFDPRGSLRNLEGTPGVMSGLHKQPAPGVHALCSPCIYIAMQPACGPTLILFSCNGFLFLGWISTHTSRIAHMTRGNRSSDGPITPWNEVRSSKGLTGGRAWANGRANWGARDRGLPVRRRGLVSAILVEMLIHYSWSINLSC